MRSACDAFLGILGIVLSSLASTNLSVANPVLPYQTVADGAQTVSTDAAVRKHLKEDIEHLAAKSRFSTEDYDRALSYVRQEIKAEGIMDSNVRVENVDGVPRWERGRSDVCELILDGSQQPMSILALTNSEPGEVKGEVVLVDEFNRGIDNQVRDHLFDGKIVFFSRPLQKSSSSKEYENTVVQRNDGAVWAAKHGALAVLVKSVQTDEGPPHAGKVTYSKKVKRIPAATLDIRDAQRLEDVLKAKEHQKVLIHLKITSEHHKRRQSNLLIWLPGGNLSNEIVLVGAHLDSHDVTPGAADDAAGVASVLAVMREFARRPHARTILVLLFANEEVGHSGGREFEKKHRDELRNIVSAIEMDDGDGAPRAFQITVSPPTKATWTKRTDVGKWWDGIANKVGSDAKLDVNIETEAYGTDLETLVEKDGITEIAILQDLYHYFDKHHAKSDTPDAIDLDGLEKATSLLVRIVDVLASDETPRPPQ